MAEPDDAGESGDGAGCETPADDAATESMAPGDAASPDGDAGESREALRERVEEEYDFEAFGPADMREMSSEEWSAAFDDDAWVTGQDLLDRVETDLRSRVATREVFAVVERTGGDRPRLVAYSDEGYAVVEGDGSIEGRGTVLRDVKPSVALASMPEYEVPDPPEDASLPSPQEVPDSDGGLGNTMLQFVGLTMGVAGLVLLVAPVFADLGGAAIVAVAVGLLFLAAAGFLGLTVANARLSARFRAEEYRDRLRAAGVEEGDRPDFLPVEDHEFED